MSDTDLCYGEGLNNPILLFDYLYIEFESEYKFEYKYEIKKWLKI